MLNLLATVAAIYLVLVVLLLVFEKKMIFFPSFPGRLSGDWSPAGLAVEDVWLTASDGVKVHAWWIAAPDAKFTFVMFHGNAANLPNRADIYRFIRALPANVLAVDYRGYGKSEGSPSEAGIYLDARAAYDHLVAERGIPPHRIISFGGSIGTAPATDLAAQREVGGLVLEAAFPSARAMAWRAYPFLPGLGALISTRFETAAKLERIHVPVLLLHCTHDPVVPFAEGEATFAAANQPKRFLRIQGACHENACLVDPESYRVALLELMQTIETADESL